MNLKRLRKAQGMSQEQAAKALGLSRTTYTKYENGIHDPSVQTLIKMSELFGVSVDMIVDGPFTARAGSGVDPDERRLLDLFHRADPGDQQAVRAILGKYAPRPASPGVSEGVCAGVPADVSGPSASAPPRPDAPHPAPRQDEVFARIRGAFKKDSSS